MKAKLIYIKLNHLGLKVFTVFNRSAFLDWHSATYKEVLHRNQLAQQYNWQRVQRKYYRLWQQVIQSYALIHCIVSYTCSQEIFIRVNQLKF